MSSKGSLVPAGKMQSSFTQAVFRQELSTAMRRMHQGQT